MERLQGPINPCLIGEHLDVECLEQGLISTGSLTYEEELEDTKMPFLQMLQSVELSSSSTSSFLPLKEPSFPTLLRLQHLKKQQPYWEEEGLLRGTSGGYNYNNMNNNNIIMPCERDAQIQALEFESCVTHDNIVVELHGDSPIKSEARDQYFQYPVLVSTSECNQEEEGQRQQQQQPTSKEEGNYSKSFWVQPDHEAAATFKQTQNPKPVPVTRERRKRKRTRPTKNKEEVETQRMTHIAVERNRRRQMNDHLNVLRSLMPTSYVQRGDQASIVGGAIDFVKELEQLLESLKAQKRMRKAEENNNHHHPVSSSSSSSSNSSSAAANSSSSNGLFMSLSQYKNIGHEEDINNNNSNSNNRNNNGVGEEVRAENKSEAADIEVTVIQTHVNLKIQCPRRPGQLLKAIVALEDLRLTILHLNITSSLATVLYSFNLKMEDGCKLGTADEIAGAVHQIFRFIDGS